MSAKNHALAFCYQKICKPIFFRCDPESVHERIIHLGQWLGKYHLTRTITGHIFDFQDPRLEQNIFGIHFKNPVGLAAGFDKDAQLTDILPEVGFGFVEVGSITAQPCTGNPKPRLWRLPEQQSLRVYYGLKNAGAQILANKLKTKIFRIPIGISIAKTNSQKTVDTEKGIEDYVTTYRSFQNIGNYDTINISCPNTFGGEPFTDPQKLKQLLEALTPYRTKKPLFLKISPDLSKQTIDQILVLAETYAIDGFICTNLTKKHNFSNGGLSGKYVEDASNSLISSIFQKTKGTRIIIGVGGIFSAEDAYKKIQLGASLVQLITGMIYQGPQLIGEINEGLTKLLKQDGFTHISQAIGTKQI